jgi:acetyl-CoA C-acetyltransferase
MSSARAAELGAPVRARIVAYASCGVDPALMGIGPVPAVRKCIGGGQGIAMLLGRG